MSIRDPQYKPSLGIVCGLCKKSKTASEFNRNCSKKTGFQYRCRCCEKKIRDENRLKRNKQKRLHYACNKRKISDERKEKYRTTRGIASHLFESSKRRAFKQNVPFTLKKNWVEHLVREVDSCPLTGRRFNFGTGFSTSESRTLDKLVPSVGYIPSNTFLISHKANTIKNNGSLEDLNALIRHLQQMLGMQTFCWKEKIRHFQWETQIISYEKNGCRTTLNKAMRAEAKKRAQKKNLAFDLLNSDVEIPLLCPVSQVKLTKGTARQTDCSPSLDRIINNKGYSPDNVQVVSYKVNRMKSDCSLEELQCVAKNWQTLQGEQHV